ncbi:MAG: hypothetical protein ABSB60_10825 [Terracidiphilus sp.]|jgi:hypothetical protein
MIAQQIENVDRRILGAFVCVDAITGSSVVPAIPVTTTQWTVKPNRNGVYVVFDGPGFDQQTGEFIPSGTWPSPATFEVSLQDPSLRYLPRRANVKAPQPVPAYPPVPSPPTEVFAPLQITVYPSPAGAIGPNWAAIHASVTVAGSSPPQGLPWAVLQIVQNSNNTVLATGLTGLNGEALLAVVGLTVQANTGGGGPVTISTVAATINAYFDPSVLTQPAGWIPNPDDILTTLPNPAFKSASQTVELSSGQEVAMSFAISL